jgi:hypothetical protein
LKNKVLCKIQINVFNIKPSYSSNNPRIMELQVSERGYPLIVFDNFKFAAVAVAVAVKYGQKYSTNMA